MKEQKFRKRKKEKESLEGKKERERSLRTERGENEKPKDCSIVQGPVHRYTRGWCE